MLRRALKPSERVADLSWTWEAVLRGRTSAVLGSASFHLSLTSYHPLPCSLCSTRTGQRTAPECATCRTPAFSRPERAPSLPPQLIQMWSYPCLRDCSGHSRTKRCHLFLTSQTTRHFFRGLDTLPKPPLTWPSVSFPCAPAVLASLDSQAPGAATLSAPPLPRPHSLGQPSQGRDLDALTGRVWKCIT